MNSGYMVMGDYRPVNTMYNGVKLAGWTETEQSVPCTFANTYNDSVGLTLAGKGKQDAYRVGVLDGELVQFSDAADGYEMLVTVDSDCTVTRCGKNISTMQPVIVSTQYQTAIDFGRDITIANAVCISFNCASLGMKYTGSACVDLLKNDGSHQYRTWYLFKINGTSIAASGNADGVAIMNLPNGVTFRKINVYWMTGMYAQLSQETELSDFQVEIGNNSAYAPYAGADYTLTAGQTVSIPVLPGANTVYASTGTVHVEYRKRSDATPSATDIVAPTPTWNGALTGSQGTVTASGVDAYRPQTAIQSSVLRAVPDGSGGWAARDTEEIVGGQRIVTRRVGVMTLVGTESVGVGNVDSSATVQQFNITAAVTGGIIQPFCLCTHFAYNAGTVGGGSNIGIRMFSTNLVVIGCLRDVLIPYGFIAGTSTTYVPAFKAFLAAQNAAGTPVTVWYVLATPTTETTTITPLKSYPKQTTITITGDYSPDATAKCKTNDIGMEVE